MWDRGFSQIRAFSNITNPRLVALAIYALVRVIDFGIDPTVSEDEFKGVVHKTAIAACITYSVTVYKLLL